MIKAKTILLTGHTGFVGQYVLEKAGSFDMKILGLSRNPSSSSSKQISCDLSTCKHLDFLENHELNGIIHLAANSNVNACEEHPESTAKINVQAAILLAKYAKKWNIPFVFASSDQIFDGNKGSYGPQDEAKPLNVYGKQKLEAEEEILACYPKAVVCRLPLMIGEKGGYEKAFLENLKAGKNQTLFIDEVRSVERASIIAESLLEAIAWKGGKYNLPGPTDMNRYALGVMLAEKHGLDVHLLSKGKQSDVKMAAERPKNVTMVRS